MPPKRRRTRLGFALFALLAILGIFALDGIAAGVTSLLAMLVFVGVCVYAARGEDADALAKSHRTGLRGWVGGWW